MAFLRPPEFLNGDVQVDDVANFFNLLDVLPLDSVVSTSAIVNVNEGVSPAVKESEIISEQLKQINQKG